MTNIMQEARVLAVVFGLPPLAIASAAVAPPMPETGVPIGSTLRNPINIHEAA
jgi:hypothetical protein